MAAEKHLYKQQNQIHVTYKESSEKCTYRGDNERKNFISHEVVYGLDVVTKNKKKNKKNARNGLQVHC